MPLSKRAAHKRTRRIPPACRSPGPIPFLSRHLKNPQRHAEGKAMRTCISIQDRWHRLLSFEPDYAVEDLGNNSATASPPCILPSLTEEALVRALTPGTAQSYG